jgi:hypothetical protein
MRFLGVLPLHDREKPRPLGRGLALGVQGGGSAPARGWGESPTLGTELGAEGAGAKLRRTSDGRVYSCDDDPKRACLNSCSNPCRGRERAASRSISSIG